MDRGLLSRIARHPRRPGRDDAENRLTEVFAAVVEHDECRGLAQVLACGWLEDAVAGGGPAAGGLRQLLAALCGEDVQLVRVGTQVSVLVGGRSRRPDLEFVFSTPGGDVVIWVEVKHGTAPHTGQLAAYVLAQRARHQTRGVVVLVAPRAAYPFSEAEVPPEVPRLTWQRTSANLSRYAAPGPIGDFLVDELRRYLREEQLMDPACLAAEHLEAFEFHTAAFAALEPICSVADAVVSRDWRPRDGPDSHDGYGADPYRRYSWWIYPSLPSQQYLAEWSLDWNLFRDGRVIFPGGRPGVPVFAAGASAEPGALARMPAHVAEALASAGFQLFTREMLRGNSYDRIWLCGEPKELLVGGSLEEQGDALGRWIVDRFRDLERIAGEPE